MFANVAILRNFLNVIVLHNFSNRWLYTYVDKESPIIKNCPRYKTVPATASNNRRGVLEYNPMPYAVDNSKEQLRTSCPMGAWQIGSRTLQCKSTDSSGNVGQCSFGFKVIGELYL